MGDPQTTQLLLMSSYRRFGLLPAKAMQAAPKPPALAPRPSSSSTSCSSAMALLFPVFPANFLICSSISAPCESWRALLG